MATLAGFVIGAVATGTADAKKPHRYTRAECLQYAQIHAIVTNGRTPVKQGFNVCLKKTKAHYYNTPMTKDELPLVMYRIRSCESGDRLPNGKAVWGTFDYKAQNPTSDASGGWQYLGSTWGGTAGYSYAAAAPPRIQDERALRDYAKWQNGEGDPWRSSAGCWR